MKKNFTPILLLFCGLLCLNSSCDDDSDDDSDKSEQLSDYIKSLPTPQQDPVLASPELLETDTVSTRDKDNKIIEICTTKKYKASSSYDEVIIMDPTTDVIFPGAILDGNSIETGEYRPIELKRAPMTISTNFMNTTGDIKAKVDEPSLSNVREAMKKMLYTSNPDGNTAAKISFQMKQVESADEIAIAVGANFNYGVSNLSEKFDFSSGKYKSHYLIKYVQEYYTLDMDTPSNVSDFFKEGTTANDMKKALTGGEVTPVYVSSVKYGRMAYFCINSESDSTSTRNELNATFKALSTSAKIETNASYTQLDKSTSISGTVIGGNAGDAVKAITGAKGMVDYIIAGGNFSKSSPGEMVSFKLSKLSDKSCFKVVSGGEYTIRNCKSVYGKLVITPKQFYGITDDNDVFGSITVQVGYKTAKGDSLCSQPVFLFNTSKENRISVNTDKFVSINTDNKKTAVLDFDKSKEDDLFLIISTNLTDWDYSKGGNDPYAMSLENPTKTVLTHNFTLKELENLGINGVIGINFKTTSGQLSKMRFDFTLEK